MRHDRHKCLHIGERVAHDGLIGALYDQQDVEARKPVAHRRVRGRSEDFDRRGRDHDTSQNLFVVNENFVCE